MSVQAGDIILLSLKGTIFNQRIIMTHTYVCEQAPTIGVTTDFAMEFILNQTMTIGAPVPIRDTYLAAMPSNYALDFATCQVIAPTRQRANRRTINSLGSVVPNATSSNQSSAITLYTPLAGRKYVATKHVGPLGRDQYALGELTVGQKALNDDLAIELTNPVGAAPFVNGLYRPVIFHKNALPGQPYYTYITGRIVQSTLRTMRRRTVGLGE